MARARELQRMSPAELLREVEQGRLRRVRIPETKPRDRERRKARRRAQT